VRRRLINFHAIDVPGETYAGSASGSADAPVVPGARESKNP
jgi:hypothetical protein